MAVPNLCMTQTSFKRLKKSIHVEDLYCSVLNIIFSEETFLKVLFKLLYIVLILVNSERKPTYRSLVSIEEVSDWSRNIVYLFS